MIAKDIMTREVCMIAPDAEIRAAARIMADAGVSALPVVDERQRIVGIVSEGDLLRRKELRTERRRSWWLEFLATSESLAEEYVKSHGGKVRDVMTPSVIAVSEETPLGEIAAVLEKHRVKRVPVLSQGTVVGIVSRADLVKALARQDPPSQAQTDAAAIRNTFMQRLRAQPWAPTGGGVGFSVTGGVVALSGFVASEEQRRALAVMAETIPGVTKVENEIRILPVVTAGA
jgi:CBS domain-containing protein